MQVCPQQMQAEGTYRDLVVPLNNRTVYQRNKHCLLWIKKTVKRKTRQVCNDTVPCVFCWISDRFFMTKKLMSQLGPSVSWFNLWEQISADPHPQTTLSVSHIKKKKKSPWKASWESEIFAPEFYNFDKPHFVNARNKTHFHDILPLIWGETRECPQHLCGLTAKQGGVVASASTLANDGKSKVAKSFLKQARFHHAVVGIREHEPCISNTDTTTHALRRVSADLPFFPASLFLKWGGM